MLNAKMVESNASKLPFTQEPPFVYLAYGIKDEHNALIAGIFAVVYCWQCLTVETLLVDPDHQNRGYGSSLLAKVETEARSRGCRLSHLDTFDFQAKDFYLKRGYEVFGTLRDCPPGHDRFYLRKDI